MQSFSHPFRSESSFHHNRYQTLESLNSNTTHNTNPFLYRPSQSIQSIATTTPTAPSAIPTTLTAISPLSAPPGASLPPAGFVTAAPNVPSVVVELTSPLTATATVAGAVITLTTPSTVTVPVTVGSVCVVQLHAFPHWPQGP